MTDDELLKERLLAVAESLVAFSKAASGEDSQVLGAAILVVASRRLNVNSMTSIQAFGVGMSLGAIMSEMLLIERKKCESSDVTSN